MNIAQKSASIYAACSTPVMQPDHTKIGLTLRLLRVKRNLSLREVARRMKLSAPYLSDLELGRRAWTQARVLEFMKALERLKS